MKIFKNYLLNAYLIILSVIIINFSCFEGLKDNAASENGNKIASELSEINRESDRYLDCQSEGCGQTFVRQERNLINTQCTDNTGVINGCNKCNAKICTYTYDVVNVYSVSDYCCDPDNNCGCMRYREKRIHVRYDVETKTTYSDCCDVRPCVPNTCVKCSIGTCP